MIEISNLEIISDKISIKAAHLKIERGEILAIFGLAGSGKSILLNAIAGLQRIDHGQIDISINDENYSHSYILDSSSKSTGKLLRKHLSMVFGEACLLSWRTVFKNVAFGLEMLKDMNRDKIEQSVLEVAELLNLKAFLDKYPHELPKIIEHKVALARALATRPEILLMDEPFLSLDPLMMSEIWDEFLSIQKRTKKTVVLATNNLAIALKIASKIAVMEKGKIIQIGTAEDIVIKPQSSHIMELIADLDQTKILRAKCIMTSLNELMGNKHEQMVQLDKDGEFKCLLDDGGRPRRSLCKDAEGRIIPWTLYKNGTFAENDIILGTEHLSIKDVFKVIGHTNRPMVIQDKNGKMIGAITKEAIFKAIFTQRSLN